MNRSAPTLEISALALQRVRAACESLQLPPTPLLAELPPTGWLPLRDPLEWLRDRNGQALPAPLRFQLGAATLQNWYHEAGGFALCPTALQVLRHHVSAGSFGQFARGPVERLGSFRLLSLDDDQGIGHVHSSTPFDREWERGLIQGALDAAGDLLFSDVVWDEARSAFVLRFVSEENRLHIPWALGEPEDAKVWRLRNRVRQLEQHNAYLEARALAPLDRGAARGASANADWLDPASGAAAEPYLLERLRQLAHQPLPPNACVIAYGLAERPSPAQLHQLGHAGQAVTRRGDLLARLGEHSLALLLLEADLPVARRVAQRLSERLQAELGVPLRLAVLPWRGGSEQALLTVAKASLKAGATLANAD